tara:strand:+ start:46 stop:372 length:327 start_codon:yes stop_codon:yes gene_type:complete
MRKKQIKWKPVYFWIHVNPGMSGSGRPIYVLQYETMISDDKVNRAVSRGDIAQPKSLAAWPKKQHSENFWSREEVESWLKHSMLIGSVTAKNILRGEIVKTYTPRGLK